MNSIYVVAAPLVGAALTFISGLVDRRGRLVKAVAVLTAVTTAVLAVLLTFSADFGGEYRRAWIPGAVDFQLNPDHLSVGIVLAASLIGALIVIYSTEYMAHYKGLTRYFTLILVFIGAMCGLVLSGNMLQMFFFWELVGVCSYSLIGFDISDSKAGKSGLKAFVTTKIGDVGLFAGILLLYSASSTKSFEFQALARDVASGRISNQTLLVAGLLLIAGAVGKSAQLPLHVWLPDAMEAPTSVSALIHAATMVNSGVYLMARVAPLFHGIPAWAQTVMWIGALTALAGSLMASFAGDLKRLLAYSTVSQLGIMMFAVGTGSVVGAFYHLMNHAVFKALLFLAAGAVIHQIGTRDIRAMGGLSARMPVTGTVFLVGSLALAGVPPFNGFWSKDMIIGHAISGHHYLPLALVLAASALTAFYSIRTYIRVFRGRISESARHCTEVGLPMLLPVIVLAFATLGSWLGIEWVSRVGDGATGLGLGDFVHEVLTSPSIALSIVVIATGLLLVSRLAPERQHGALASWAKNGLYFDVFYAYLARGAGKLGAAMADFIDHSLLGNIGAWTVRAAYSASRKARKMHTGDASLGLSGVVAGLLVLAVIILIEARFMN